MPRPAYNKTDQELEIDSDAAHRFRFLAVFRIRSGSRRYRLWFENVDDRAEFLATNGVVAVALGQSDALSQDNAEGSVEQACDFGDLNE